MSTDASLGADDFDAGLRPPFGPAPGPLTSDAEVVACFVRAEPSGHSRNFYLEGPLLIGDGDHTVAICVAPEVVLVRTDLPDELRGHRDTAEAQLRSSGLTLLDEETLWGVPVALQLAGLRLSSWDLWGIDMEWAFEAVRAVAVGQAPGDAPS